MFSLIFPLLSYRNFALFWNRECYAIESTRSFKALSGVSRWLLICIATTVVRPNVRARASCGICDVT